MSNYLGFNINPTATSGQGAYGQVPGQTGVPPSIWDETNAAVPGMAGLTTGTSSVIGSELSGQLSPATMMNMGNQAASRGVSLGQPNSSISNMIGLNLTGTTTEGLQNQGVSNYMNFLSGVGSQQLDPSLTSSIAQSNALLGAAPDPNAAASQEQSLMQQYYSMMNPAGGNGSFTSSGNPMGNYSQFPMFGGGGTGTFASANPYYGGSGGSEYGQVYNTYGNDSNNSTVLYE